MADHPQRIGTGPFHAQQLRPGDRYELSEGHAIYCAPSGGTHARATVTGSIVIDTDPDVDGAAMDAGFSPEDGTLRAPDIAVGVPDRPGWIKGVPPLAIEYASGGQDEVDLQAKIRELIAAGTRFVWVVRLVGPRRVEVYTTGAPVRVLGGSDTLEAPGILRKSLPVAALYDREVAHARALENLLERHGYRDLEDVRTEGREEGRTEGREEGRTEGREEGREAGREEGREAGRLTERRAALVEILTDRFGPLPQERLEALDRLDLATLRGLTRRALTVPDLDALFASATS